MAHFRAVVFLLLLVAVPTPAMAASIAVAGIFQVGCNGPAVGNLISFAGGTIVDPAGHATYTGMTSLGQYGEQGPCGGSGPTFLGLSNGQSTTITFDAPIDLFAFAWGSIDHQNRVQLYRDSLLVGDFFGEDLDEIAGVNFGSTSLYVFVGDSAGFNKVVLSEYIQHCCFETQGHRYRLMESSSDPDPSPVPEPSTVLLATLGAFALRRVKAGSR